MKKSKGDLSSHTKTLKGKGKISPIRQTKQFAIGAKVLVKPQSLRTGRPALRYNDRRGTILEKRGTSYVVSVVDGNMIKKLICHPMHLVAS